MKKALALSLTVLLSVLPLFRCSKKNDHAVSGSGTLEARRVMVSAKTGGQVLELAVHEGEAVTTGMLIARLDVEKAEIQRRQAEAALRELHFNLANAERAVQIALDALENTEKKHQRISALLAEGGATQQQFDDLDTALKAARMQYENARAALLSLKAKEEQAKAQLELLDSQIRDGSITAPIDGVIIETFVEKGELARPGAAVAEMADLSSMWIKIYVKEEDLWRLKPGSAADVIVSSAPAPYRGRVTWISDKAEFTPKNVQTKEARADLVYAVKVEVNNVDGRLKIGMPADVVIKDQTVAP